jgi:DNA-directed RNA polymerase subunit beta
VEGTVIDAKIFSRKGAEKDQRSQSIEEEAIKSLQKDRDDEIAIISESVRSKAVALFSGKTAAARLMDQKKKKIFLKKGEVITKDLLAKIPIELWQDIALANAEAADEKVGLLLANLRRKTETIEARFAEKMEKVKASDELPPGVIKLVKVYIAIKRKLSVGDKMAGRHGNKGVLSRILPEEDMPYFEDGTPVDIVLNPLGVPSRMNVGQILETHLGLAANGVGAKINAMLEKAQSVDRIKKELKAVYGSPEFSRFIDGADEDEVRRFVKRLKNGIPVATPVFDGTRESEIREMLRAGGMPETGQTILYDGRSGEPFDQEITVGIIYMLKLHHLVDNKIHARSIGPYSLVTQQPLGGKAQFGGQRLGEMEVWAMEAYGAAYSLQEFLTVKSDDVAGRTRIYEAIVKGEHTSEPGLPESFNVLVKELQSLSLDVELIEEE